MCCTSCSTPDAPACPQTADKADIFILAKYPPGGANGDGVSAPTRPLFALVRRSICRLLDLADSRDGIPR